MTMLDRRFFLAGAGALGVSGCVSTGTSTTGPERVAERAIPEIYRTMYGAMPDERFPIPAADLKELDQKFFRQQVDYSTDERVGTVIVDIGQKFLYLTQEGGKAMRYGVGIGRQGFSWAGRAEIAWKQPWPKWTPPAEMIERQPELEQYRDGMAPGLLNPLGARALYLFQNGRDTLYRLHGTNDIRSIGRAVSSGCVRLINQDVIDLYNRVPARAEVVVLQPVPPLVG